jgi:cell division protein FtsL
MRLRSPLHRSPASPLRPRAGEPPHRALRFTGRARRRPPQPWALTGRDVSTAAPPPRRFAWPRPAALGTVAAGAVCAALLLVSLRMDSIRLRYALADAVRVEQELLDQQRRLTVQVRHLRDPRRLEALARELGMGPPGCMIDLDHPRPCPEPAS